MKNCISIFIFVVIGLAATTAAAQTKAKVLRDQATIWRPGFATVATVVSKDTELVVVARRGTWYEVVLPSGTIAGDTGLIAVSQVEIISGPMPPERPLVSPAAAGQVARGRRPPEPHVGVRGFGTVGFEWYDAHQTFSAIFGQPGGVQYGGGVEVRVGQIFILGTVEHFSRTGQRAFVNNGQVFGLGIADNVSMTPVSGTIGYRFHGTSVNPYVGVGVGVVQYSETSDFAAAGDNVDSSFTSVHVLAGVEWRGRNPWLGVAFEVQYTNVPSALTGGLADALNEHNLGGVEGRVKIELGR